METWKPFPFSEDAKNRLLAWTLSRDTGVSSKTIACIALGLQKPGHFGFDIPYDGGDFGRCYRLLQKVPELRDALPLVAEVCPKWRPLVERWDDIEAAYLQDLSETPEYEMVSHGRGRRKTRLQTNQRACYDLLSSLRNACYEADGMVQTSPGCWQRRDRHAA